MKTPFKKANKEEEPLLSTVRSCDTNKMFKKSNQTSFASSPLGPCDKARLDATKWTQSDCKWGFAVTDKTYQEEEKKRKETSRIPRTDQASSVACWCKEYLVFYIDWLERFSQRPGWRAPTDTGVLPFVIPICVYTTENCISGTKPEDRPVFCVCID